MSQLLLLILWAFVSTGPAWAQQSPRALHERIKRASLDTARSVRIHDVRLQTGMAVLLIEDGVLVPAAPLGERTAEMVFMGKGRLLLEPPDEIEAGQLELFTGSRDLDATFTEAIFVVGRDAASDTLLDREPAEGVDPARIQHAARLYEAWKGGAIRRLAGVESALFLDALGDEAYDEYFAAWMRGSDLGEFYYVVDPAAAEQVLLGQFIPMELTDREKYELSLEEKWQKGQGRLVGQSIDDFGQYDTWLSAALRGDDGQPLSGTPGFEPERYVLDVEVQKGSQRISGVAWIEARAVSGRRKAARLALSTDLDVKRILHSDGRELFFVRNGWQIVVPLPAPVPAGESITLKVEFEGNPLERIEGRSWALRDTSHWYPRMGEIDRARYDVTFRWPKSLDLLAAGHHVDGGLTDNGMHWEQRVQDVPTAHFSFEIGEFKIVKLQAGEIAVRIAFDKDLVKYGEKEQQESVQETVMGSLEFFQETFGSLPLKEFTVVTVYRNFSQGFLGFLTLSGGMIYFGKPGSHFGMDDRRAVIAHEVAHQWWGNLVGWESYRDQWISEAMANYSAMLYAREKLGLSRAKLRGPTSGWAKRLEKNLADGRTIESVGPMVLGQRLDSSLAPNAYDPIVYLKGALVLGMLSRYFKSEEIFPELMGHIVQAASNSVISTEDYLYALETMTGTDLDWFSQQYIYGTGIPEIYYSYEFEELESGKWLVEGKARQESDYRYVYRIVETEGDGFDVQRTKIKELDTENSMLITPFQCRLAMEQPAGGKKRKKARKGSVDEVYGRILLKGDLTEFSFEVDREPKIFWLDRNDQILAHCYDESYYPKGTLLKKGVRFLSDGRLEEAEKTLKEALQAPLVADTSEVSGSIRKRRKRDTEWKHARIHLYLARLYLDQGRADRAEEELKATRGILDVRQEERYQAWLTRTEARIQIQRGEYEAAFKRLNKLMMQKHRSDSTEGYLLLAIAARALGKEAVLTDSLEAAEEKGADFAAFTAKNR